MVGRIDVIETGDGFGFGHDASIYTPPRPCKPGISFPSVFNFALNGAIAWAVFRAAAVVPLWGQQSIAVDTIGTTFLLPFLTCLLVTRLVQRQTRSGRIQALGLHALRHGFIRHLPQKTFYRALALGGLCVSAIAPPTLLALVVSGLDALPFAQFLVFKASFAAALAAAVAPVIALRALCDAPAQLPSTEP